MPRIQIFIDQEAYSSAESNPEHAVTQFFQELPAFVASEFAVPEENVLQFVAPKGSYDRSPVDVDITISVKFTPEAELNQKAVALHDFASSKLSPLSVGCHVLLFEKDAWSVG